MARIEGQAARCSTAKAAKSKVNCPLSRIFIVDRSSLRWPNKMLRATLQCNFRNSFTLQNNATIRSETIANALSPPRNFPTFFFYEPINTQLFELHYDEHTPWNYQPMQRNTSLNAFGIRFTDSSHVDPVFLCRSRRTDICVLFPNANNFVRTNSFRIVYFKLIRIRSHSGARTRYAITGQDQLEIFGLEQDVISAPTSFSEFLVASPSSWFLLCSLRGAAGRQLRNQDDL